MFPTKVFSQKNTLRFFVFSVEYERALPRKFSLNLNYSNFSPEIILRKYLKRNMDTTFYTGPFVSLGIGFTPRRDVFFPKLTFNNQADIVSSVGYKTHYKRLIFESEISIGCRYYIKKDMFFNEILIYPKLRIGFCF